MDELRDKIAAIVSDEVYNGDEDYWAEGLCHRRIADRILAIPEIAEALECRAMADDADSALHDFLMSEREEKAAPPNLGHSISTNPPD